MLINNAYQRTEEILTAHRDKLDELSAYLVKHEKIKGEDFQLLMKGELKDEPEEIPTTATEVTAEEDK